MNTNELPILQYKNHLIEMVRKHQVVIVYGETGSGKTTQIPQYILKESLNNGRIIGITQPRRIGAISTCNRVSEEMKCEPGSVVGYQIQFDDKSDNSTKIKFMTDGILLNQCLNDTKLSLYGVIMIDEAHERSINSDILLGLLKGILPERKDLKVIITSATMKTERFSAYFNNAEILNIEGRMFPIRLKYETPDNDDYISCASNIVKKIHERHSNGDILIFLSGLDEINKCSDNLIQIEDLVIVKVHASMDQDTQQRAFLRVPSGKRKVVIATNVAENTITIDNIRFVIDCGYVKQNCFNFERSMNEMMQERISKAQADQRKGRCGRTVNGVCYRLYSSAIYENMLETCVPDILRQHLSEIYLKIITVGIDPETFPFMDPPEIANLQKARIELQDLSLLDNEGHLTELGKKMRNVPVNPVLGTVLLHSYNFYCATDVITIMTSMTESNLFIRSNNTTDDSESPQRIFYDSDGDHFMNLNIFNQFVENGNKKIWCDDHFLNYDTLVQIIKTRHQLITMMSEVIPVDNYSSSIDRNNIKKAIIKGYYKNICKKISKGKYESYLSKETLYIHPVSCLYKDSPDLVLYHETNHTTKAFMKGIMKLDPSVLTNFTHELERLNIDLDNL